MADFSHVVYQSTDGESLFTFKSIISMCTIETLQLKSVPQYTDLCETKVREEVKSSKKDPQKKAQKD